MAKKDNKKEIIEKIIEEIPEAKVVKEEKKPVIENMNDLRKKYFAAFGEWPISDEDLRIAGLL